VKPGATEICNNRDDNCDNMTDEGLGMLTCGSAPCVTMIPACASGVSQTCTPVCPPDAGTDAPVATASDTTPDAVADTAPSTDAPDTDTPPADAPAADAAPGSDSAVADSAPASDSRPPDATGSDARPSDSRDGGTKVSDGEGCNCRLGGDRAGTGATPLLLAALLLSLMLRRRRR
jgi:MYXO-CTERM domain-containing protein